MCIDTEELKSQPQSQKRRNLSEIDLTIQSLK